MIYYRPGKVPTRWPLNSLRRYGTDRDTVFIFEAGRSSPMEGIFAFQLNRTADLNRLANRIKEIMEKLSTNDPTNNNPIKHDQNVHILSRQYVPDQQPQGNVPSISETFNNQYQKKRDATTSTDNNQSPNTYNIDTQSDPRPLSYVLIDFDTTKALEESAQAHAANRQTHMSE